MTLGIVWFILVGVLIAGYAIFDGFDLGVGILYPFLGKSEEDKTVMRTRDRAGVGRQRGVAAHRRRRAVRRVPSRLRDGLQRLLHPLDAASVRAALPGGGARVPLCRSRLGEVVGLVVRARQRDTGPALRGRGRQHHPRTAADRRKRVHSRRRFARSFWAICCSR